MCRRHRSQEAANQDDGADCAQEPGQACGSSIGGVPVPRVAWHGVPWYNSEGFARAPIRCLMRMCTSVRSTAASRRLRCVAYVGALSAPIVAAVAACKQPEQTPACQTPEGEPAASTDQGTVVPMKPAQDPVIQSNLCTQYACGGTMWQVSFILPVAAANSGWVVQEIRDDLDSAYPDGGVPEGGSLHSHFWEGFYVPAGAKETGHLYGASDDTFSALGHAANTTGTETVIGKAKFYEGTLPPDFVPCNDAGLAGTRRATVNPPEWWDGTGTPHSLTMDWDCTDGNNVRSVQTDPPGNCE